MLILGSKVAVFALFWEITAFKIKGFFRVEKGICEKGLLKEIKGFVRNGVFGFWEIFGVFARVAD